MEEHVYASYLVNNLGLVGGVGAVGVSFVCFVEVGAVLCLPSMSFGEEEAAGRHFMFERYSLDRECAVVDDDLLFAWIDIMEDYFECKVCAVVVEQWVQQFLQVWMCVDMQWLCTMHHAERGYQSDESEAVVAMEVRDEYGV